jgi:microcystin-dependent protein
MNVNQTGLIRLSSDGINPDIAAGISFDRVKTEFPSFLAMNSNVLAAGDNSNQITVMNNTRTGYEDLALSKLVLYGNASIGSFPIAQFVEQGVSGNLSIVSPQVNISTLNALNLIGVSTINGVPPPFGGGGGGNLSTFNQMYANIGNFSSILVSSINGSEFTSTGINVITLSTSVLAAQQAFLSTITFNPSLGGVAVKPNIDLGMGGFLGGLAGGLGGGVFNAILGAAALTTGVMALTQSRGTNSINSNNYELVNGTTQLQFSTLGTQTTSILRLVSSITPNIPGVEFFQSTIISPGTNCIRSLSDPLNIANPDIATSTLQAFGQWVPLPTAVVADTIQALTVSSINSFGWNQIQYQNQQPTINQGNLVVVNANNNILYIGLSIATLPTPTNTFYSINLVNGQYTYQTFVNMVNAVLGQSGGPSQIQLTVNPTTNIISINAVDLNISPIGQTYTIIWNPSTGPPYSPAFFNPPWTPLFITASSVLFGAALTNVIVTINPLSITRVLPQPINVTTFIGPVAFGPYLQLSTLLVASTINCPLISTNNINLQTINGAAYPPSGSQFQSSFSTLFTSSINSYGWDQIQYWNMTPVPNSVTPRTYTVTAGVNDVLLIQGGSTSGGYTYSTAFILTAGTYTLATFITMVNGIIQAQDPSGAPRRVFENISLQVAPGQLIQFVYTGGAIPPPVDTTYIVIFNPTNAPSFTPVVSGARVTQSGILFGADTSAVYPLTPPTGTTVVMPNLGGNTGIGPIPFGPYVQTSTLIVQSTIASPYISTNNLFLQNINGTPYIPSQSSFSTLFTSSINSYGWDQIQFWNMASIVNSITTRRYIVTTGVNDVLLINSSSVSAGFNFSTTFILTAGTYTPTTFVNMINALILAQDPTGATKAFNNITIAATGPSNQPLLKFTNSTGPVPPAADTIYIIVFQPSQGITFTPSATPEVVTQSGLLFGSSPSSAYTVLPGTNVILPIVGGSQGIGPVPFGADLQVSSINIQGIPVPVSSLTPVGAIIAFAGQTAPAGWLLCNGNSYGDTDPVYSALFAVIGYTYGGSGFTGNFLVPNLTQRQPLMSTVGAIGNTGGSSAVTISISQMPSHTHTYSVFKGGLQALAGSGTAYACGDPNTTFGTAVSQATPAAGAQIPTPIQNPYLVMNYIIKI